MKTELFYLLLTAILTGTLWAPVTLGYWKSRGLVTAQQYAVAATSPLPDWVNRAIRAHANAVESFVPFAAVVLIASALNVSTPITVGCAATFFFARVAHAIAHISGTAILRARTVAFTIAYGAFAVYAGVLLVHFAR